MFSLFLLQEATLHGPLNELKGKEMEARGEICTAVRRVEGLRFLQYYRILFEGIGEEKKSVLNLITAKKNSRGQKFCLWGFDYDKKSSNRNHLEVVPLSLNYSHIRL
jgi:hypothetical protein